MRYAIITGGAKQRILYTMRMKISAAWENPLLGVPLRRQ